MTTPAFDPLSPAYLLDPYATMRRLREASPVCWVEHLQIWAVASHEALSTVLAQPDLYSSELGLGTGWRLRDPRPPAKEMSFQAGIPGVRVLIGIDRPDHSQLRRLLSGPFARTSVRAMESRIEAITRDLFDELLRRGADRPVDVVELLAEPLPCRALGMLLGLPDDISERLSSWAGSVSSSWDPTNRLALASSYRRLARQGFDMLRTLLPFVSDRCRSPREDGLVDVMAKAHLDDPTSISEMEIVSNLILLVLAGVHTTTSGIGSVLHLLARRPDVFELARSQPAIIPNLVEEALRLESPIQSSWRGARADCELAGVQLRAGDRMMLMFGSANRDEAQFERADELDLSRPGLHQTFGSGIHACIGAFLARTELRVAVEVAVDVVESMSLVRGQPTRNLIVRGMDELVLDVVPRRQV